ASEELGANTLSTVRYVEFSLPSCHNSSKREIHMCKQLVPFLKQYMPYLQTLHIWRPDDFPWTSTNIDTDEISDGLICHNRRIISVVIVNRFDSLCRYSKYVSQSYLPTQREIRGSITS
ncbi:unnamed protein product, partial [Rotaria magnacalcarata]